MTTQFKRWIKYEADTDTAFTRSILETDGGERLRHCIQCGTCSATCPLSTFMDYTPRRLIQMTREGFKDEVLSSFTIWLCASCYACTCDCPKEIKVTDIMYALKRRAIRDGVYPKRSFPIPVLAREFYKMVYNRGRVSESWLVVWLVLKTNLLKFFGMTRLGLGLLRTGRFSLKSESIERREELQKLLEAVGSAK
jgi:quinone-modifying oxidoreductase subunit QmoC